MTKVSRLFRLTDCQLQKLLYFYKDINKIVVFVV